MKNEIKPQRDISLDIVRILACFAVIVVHVSANSWSVADVHSYEWKVMNFYNSAMRGSVPIFFMLSGQLFLSREEPLSIKTLYKKYIVKLILVYLFWGIFYAVDNVGIRYITIESFPDILYSFCLKPKVHLWFLPAMVGIYFLMPVLWTVAKFEGGKYLRYSCVMFFLFGVAWYSIQLLVPPRAEITTIINRFSYALSGYSGYFLLGYYLSKINTKRSPLWFFGAYLIVIFIGSKIGEIHSLQVGKQQTLLYGNFSIMTFLEAVTIYLAFKNCKFDFSLKISKCIAKISQKTFFIYGFHMFVISQLNMKFSFNEVFIDPIIAIPLVSLVTFIISLTFAYLIGFFRDLFKRIFVRIRRNTKSFG